MGSPVSGSTMPSVGSAISVSAASMSSLVMLVNTPVTRLLVRSSCIGNYVRHGPGVAPDGTRLEVPFYTLDYQFVLQPLS